MFAFSLDSNTRGGMCYLRLERQNKNKQNNQFIEQQVILPKISYCFTSCSFSTKKYQDLANKSTEKPCFCSNQEPFTRFDTGSGLLSLIQRRCPFERNQWLKLGHFQFLMAAFLEILYS